MDAEYSFFELELDRPVAVLAARGRYNLRAVWALQLQCETLYGQGYSFIVIDMSGVTYIAAGGAATLVNMTYDFLGRDGLFQIAAVPEPAMRVIDMLNSRQFLNIATDVDDAKTRLLALNTAE
jgi:anti-anti-sigma regulatory factor